MRWQQVQEARRAGSSLADLTFIASIPLIQTLSQQVAAQKIAVAQLQQRHRAKHPRMLEAMQSLTQTETELNRALDTAANSSQRLRDQPALFRADPRRSGRAGDVGAQARSHDGRIQVLPERARGKRAVARQHCRPHARDGDVGQHRNPDARRLDRAIAPHPSDYSSPKILLNLAMGWFGGAGLGLAFAFFVAFIDDRVKSAFDIEAVVGLPLVAIAATDRCCR